MKVRVEIEIPKCCGLCVFHNDGYMFADRCVFGNKEMILDRVRSGRSTGCPLEKCERVDEDDKQ